MWALLVLPPREFLQNLCPWTGMWAQQSESSDLNSRSKHPLDSALDTFSALLVLIVLWRLSPLVIPASLLCPLPIYINWQIQDPHGTEAFFSLIGQHPCQDQVGWFILWQFLSAAPQKSQPGLQTCCLCVRRQKTPGPNPMVVMTAKSKIDFQTQELFGWLWPTCKHKYYSCWKGSDLRFYSGR